MTPRLKSHVIVAALLRRVNDEGGNGVVLAKGDADSGAIVLLCITRGVQQSVLELALDARDRYVWRKAIEQASEKTTDFQAYLDGRRKNDRDLWLIELDIANAERLAAETIGAG